MGWVAPCAAGSPVTQLVAAPASYICRVSPSEDIQVPLIVKDILRRGLNKVAIFAETTTCGEFRKNDVCKAPEAANMKPVHVASLTLGMEDLSDRIETARSAGRMSSLPAWWVLSVPWLRAAVQRCRQIRLP